VAFLCSMRPRWIEVPQPLNRNQLVHFGKDGLIERFLHHNDYLKELCEMEKKDFDDIITLWRMPRQERKRKCPNWKKRKEDFLKSNLKQEAYTKEQDEIKSILLDVYNVNIIIH